MNSSILPANDPALQRVAITPAEQHPATVYLASLLSAHSRRTMTTALNTIANLLGSTDYASVNWAALRFQHIAAIRTRLADKYSPASANKMLSALRGVLKAAWRLDQIPDAEYRKAIDIPPVSGNSQPAGRDIKQGEFLALSEACQRDTSAAGARDAALIGILYTAGLRRSEAVKLELADYTPNAGQLVIRMSKRGKTRTVYIEGGARAALEDWLAERGTAAGALFQPVNKGGKIQPRRMTEQAIYYLLEKRGKEAGLKDFSPHDFRRTFVGDLLDRGVDIATVASIAGHASVTTTQRYDRRGEERKQAAAAKLHFPYKRRTGG